MFTEKNILLIFTIKFLSHILCLSDKIEYSPNHIFEGTYVWIPRKNAFSPSNNNMVT